jgi:hypothetical protein
MAVPFKVEITISSDGQAPEIVSQEIYTRTTFEGQSESYPHITHVTVGAEWCRINAPEFYLKKVKKKITGEE